MRKRLVVLLSILLVLGLSACHKSNNKDAFVMDEDLSVSDERVFELTFWAKNDSNVDQANVYKKAIRDFNELYPNIHITMKTYNDYTKIYNDVITNIATDTTPNICITYPDHIATYLTGNNVVADLDSLLQDPRYGLGGSELLFDSPTYDQMIGKYMDECEILGHHYALPFMRSTEALYINVDLLEKLGYELPEQISWDFVFEVSGKAMEKQGDVFKVNGQKVMIPFIYKSTDNMMIQMLKQKGIPYSDESGNILMFNDDTKEILKDISSYAAQRAFATFKIVSYPGNFLNAGQCIFAVDSSAGATWMGVDAPNLDISDDQLVDFNIAVTEIPQFDFSDPQMISQGPSICVFNKKDKEEVLASWLFAQFLLSDEVQVAYASTEGYCPVSEKAIESEIYQDYISSDSQDGKNYTDENAYFRFIKDYVPSFVKDDKMFSLYYPVKLEASKLLNENVDHTFVTPVFNGSASLRQAAGQLIENVTTSERRGTPVDENVLSKIYEDTISLYRLNQLGDNAVGKKELGELPKQSVMLLTGLGVVWLGIGFFFVRDKIRSREDN